MQTVFQDYLLREMGRYVTPHDVTLFNLSHISSLPITEADMISATILRTVLRYAKTGWPLQIQPEMKAY